MWSFHKSRNEQHHDRDRGARSRRRYVLRLEPLELRKLLDAGEPGVHSSLVANGNPATAQNSSLANEIPALISLYKAYHPELNLPPTGTVTPPTLPPFPPATSQIPPRPTGFVSPPPPLSYVLTQLHLPPITPPPAPRPVALSALHKRTPAANYRAMTHRVSPSGEGPFLNLIRASFGERSWHGFIVHDGPRVEH
jgi:hypothetical protein